MRFFGTKDIKFDVKRFIERNKNSLTGKVVIDCPAGSGYSTELLKLAGANVEAYDLFPEFFKYTGVSCSKADLEDKLPISDAHADYVLFQEGIEHLPDQLKAMREMNRVLKHGGKLLVTTPNYSNLRAKLSYFLNESEQYKLMPPNQIDSIWFSGPETGDKRFYFGHMFLIGVQRLMLLATLTGFKCRKIHYTRINHTSLFLLILMYPFILFFTYRAYRRALRKTENVNAEIKKRIFRDVFMMQINPKILTDGHLFIEFEKYCELDQVVSKVDIFNKHENADFQT